MDKTIKKGYKQTDIGVIPDDWKVKNLEEVSERVSVGLATSVTKYYRNKGIPIIRNLNIKDGFFDDSDMLYLDEDFAKANLSKSAKGLDVLTVHTGANLGLTCVLPKSYDKCQTFTTLITTPQKWIMNSYYLCYHMNSFFGKKEMKKLEVGGGKGNLNTADLKKYRVFFPPTNEEQTAIATVLSDTDMLIERLEKLIAKKKAIKQGTMQQLLTGKKRLPGFNGEWEVKTLGEIGKFKGGSGFPIKYQGKVESKYPFYKVSDMNNKGNQTFMRNSNNWIDESTKKIIGSNVFPEHTIVFAKIGAAIYLERKKILFMKSCIDNNMMGFIFDESQSDYRFLHYLFLSIQLGKLVSATALPSLNGKQIAELSFAFPRKKEQTAIATVLSDMDAEIEILEKKRNKYIMLKQGMMQQLLTGRIRIYDNN